MKIAVIGSGIAGLSAAWLLGQKYSVTLFERHASPGMGAYNLDYNWQGRTVRIDVPLRAFNPNHYRQLVPLYRHLGIELQRTDHSAAYSRPGEKHPYFAYRYIDVGDYAIPRLAGWRQWSLPSAHIVTSMARFLWQAKRENARGELDRMSIADYLYQKGYPRHFSEGILLPSFAAIATCSYEAIRQYPASYVADFMTSGMLFNGIWRVRQGADQAIARLIEPCTSVQCLSDIRALSITNGPDKSPRIGIHDSAGLLDSFDYVVLATQANQAVRLIESLPECDELRSCLEKVPYERSEVVVHGDTRLAPGFGAKSAPVMFEVDEALPRPMASIHLNALYPELKEAPPLFQTWNPVREPEPSLVIGRAHFERPLVTLESHEAMQRLQALQARSDNRVLIAGSYACPGIPLLESALQSSLRIARIMNISPPF